MRKFLRSFLRIDYDVEQYRRAMQEHRNQIGLDIRQYLTEWQNQMLEQEKKNREMYLRENVIREIYSRLATQQWSPSDPMSEAIRLADEYLKRKNES